jgi:lysophospholipase L1-like esterase
MRSFWHSRWGRPALGLIACVVTLTVVEIGFRLFAGPSPYLSGLELGQYPDNPRDYFDDMGAYFSIRTDPSLHQCEASVDSSRKQVLFLGDSFTRGLGVRTSDTVSSRLAFPGMQRRNCAVSGRAIAGVLRDLNREKERRNPHIVIYGMVLNDLGPGDDQEAINLGLKHGFSPCRFKLTSDVSLGGDLDRLNDHIFFNSKEFQDYLDARMERDFGVFRFLLNARMVSWFYESRLQTEIAAHTDAWYRHCFAEGDRLENALDLIGQMKSQADHFIVMLWPLFVDLEAYPFAEIHEQIRSKLAERDIEVLDLLSIFQGEDALDFAVHTLDRHPNEVAHKRAAQALKERLEHLGWATPTVED